MHVAWNSFYKKEPETLQWISEFSNNEKLFSGILAQI